MDCRGPDGARLLVAVWANLSCGRSWPLQQRRKIPARKTGLRLCDMLRRPLRDDLAAAGTTLRTQVDDPVRGFYYIQIMLDDYDSITLISQPMNHFEQQRDIVEVQAGGRFVENVESPTRIALAQFQRKLDALRFAARQSGC